MWRMIIVYSGLAATLLLLFGFSQMFALSWSWRVELGLFLTAGTGVLLGILWTRLHAGTERAKSEASGIKTSPLTERESEVLALIAQGFSNREMAMALFVSENTIKSHVSHILEKLHARRRTEAVARARQLGLLTMI